jgi:multicomponent K+:H+ antiporter subunit D
MTWANHLLIAPVLLPLVTGALLLLFDERRHSFKALVSLFSTLTLLAISIALMAYADVAPDQGAATKVYLLGNWAAPFGIVLVLDRLSALMLVLTSVLAIAALTFSLARWHKGGPHFHTLFQFLLMGLNGAFLTGDLFNLFVFFEVFLAASYGLALHGSGTQRVKAGLHYVVINLAGASLFLIGVSLIYGVTGTLNMADLALRIPLVDADNRMLLEAGAAILGIAFLIKAGMWPLGFWLPTTYSAAAAPVAAIFAMLSKVGIYILLRLSLLLFGANAGPTAGFGEPWLLYGGMATIAFGAIGVLASQAMGRLAGSYVLVSSGTLLAAIGMANVSVTSGALFYMVSSTLTISAFFLLIELVERAQDPAAHVLAVTMEVYGDDLDEEEVEAEVGVAIPATLVILGICFTACAVLLAGMPPLSGFVAKFAILTALLNPQGLGVSEGTISIAAWCLVTLLIFSGLAAMIAMTRAGIRTFWAPIEGTVPRVLVMEFAPVAFLLVLCVGLTIQGGKVMAYMDATAQSLHDPQNYIADVMSAQRLPGFKSSEAR